MQIRLSVESISIPGNSFKTFETLVHDCSPDSTRRFLRSESYLPKNCFICFIESPLKMAKNDFYFILKAFLVLNIF